MTSPSSSFEHKQKLLKDLSNEEFRYWLEQVVFTPQWWLLIVLLILPWFIWWKLVDRKRIFEILTVGYMVFLIVLFLDEIGTETLLWGYRYRTTPFFHVLIPYDFTVLPVTYMLFYQWFSTWKSYFWAHVGLALVFAFISEPLLQWIEIYVVYDWKHIYSFPIYVLIALIIRWGMKGLIHNMREP
jgi:hypothetical protein